MKSDKQVLVIGSCIRVFPNCFDLRFRGHYLGHEIKSIRVYTNHTPDKIHLGLELVAEIEVICCLGNVLEGRLVGFNVVE